MPASRADLFVATASHGLVPLDPPVPMMLFGPGMRIRWLSSAVEEQLGLELATSIGRFWYDIFPQSVERKSLHDELFEGTRDSLDVPHVPLLNAEGEPRAFALRLRSLRDANGAVTGVFGVGEEITARVRSEAALRASEARFRAMSVSSRDIVLVIDSEARMTFGNDAMERVLGRPVKLGLSVLANMHPDDVPNAYGLLRRLVADPVIATTNDLEVRVRHEDGSYRWLHITAVNLLADEAVRGIVINGRDITARKNAEAVLAESQARLQTVLKGSAVGIWDLDLATRRLQVDENCARIASLARDQRPETLEDWLRSVDVGQHADARYWFSRAVAAPGIWHDFEYRHYSPGGAVRWVLIRGRAETDETGNPVRLAGVALDVDVRKSAEIRLAEREAQLETALWSSKSAWWTLDVATRQLTVGDDYFDVTGVQRADLGDAGAPWPANVHPDDVPRMLLLFENCVAGRSDFFEGEYRVGTAEGWRWIHDRGRVIDRDAEGRPLRIGGTSHDATARKQLESAITEAASREQRRLSYDLHDGLGQELTGVQFLLTGVANSMKAGRGVEVGEIEQIAQVVRRAIVTTRSIAHGLAPPSLAHGSLVTALRELAGTAETTLGLHVDVRTQGAIDGLVSRQVAEHLYRIAQEALANACRHGGATDVTLRLWKRGRYVVLSLTDNGGGLLHAQTSGTGLGLRIMAHRAQMIGSQLHVRNARRGGVRVLVRWPTARRGRSAA